MQISGNIFFLNTERTAYFVLKREKNHKTTSFIPQGERKVAVHLNKQSPGVKMEKLPRPRLLKLSYGLD